MKSVLKLISLSTFYSILGCGLLWQGTTSCQMKVDTVTTAEKTFEWVQSQTGGGGYITGLVQSPTTPDVWYARCDVAGVFISNDGGASWEAINEGMERWFHHSVRSIAIDPSNPDILFRCSGDVRNNEMFGSIHKSVDAGKSWKVVSDKVGFYGNGPSRMFGELIQVDPFDGNKVLVAGFEGGIWTSTDAGENWAYRTGDNKSFAVVGINPYFKGTYYAAAKDGTLYKSSNAGEEWEEIFVDNQWHFTELLFDKRDPEIIYGATIETNVSTANDRTSVTGGIYKSTNGGKSFRKMMNGLPEEFQYNTLTAHPDHPEVLYTAPDARPGHELSPVPIFKSNDGGDNWQLITQIDWPNLNGYPSYIRSLQHVGWAISKLRVDVADIDHLYFSNWYGVSQSRDGGSNWDANGFIGLETNCLENISVFYRDVYYTVADHSPMRSIDKGETFSSFPSPGLPSSTALTVSGSDPDFRIFGARNKGTAALVSYIDGNVKILKRWDQLSYVQAIREDPFVPGFFFAYVDGRLDQAGGLYLSEDRGQSWQKLNLKLEDHITQLPHNAEFIENELLNIVIGQRKNVVGADKLLCMDPFEAGTIYFGEWTEGLYKSSNRGSSWSKIGKGLPFHQDTAAVLTVIKADPKNKGTLYAGFIKEGLWRSTDSGENWQKVYPMDNSVFNVNAMQVSGNDIYIGGEDLYWSPFQPTILMSNNKGENWVNIYDKSKGALRIKGLDIDPVANRLYVASSGNGAFYVDLR
jgi:photosystem II stability/assembly factor-like uncharacterized protein